MLYGLGMKIEDSNINYIAENFMEILEENSCIYNVFNNPKYIELLELILQNNNLKLENEDLLLNYVIGQYDTYTTMQLSEYISTIATGGIRYKPHLLKEVYESDNGSNLGTLLYILHSNLHCRFCLLF